METLEFGPIKNVMIWDLKKYGIKALYELVFKNKANLVTTN